MFRRLRGSQMYVAIIEGIAIGLTVSLILLLVILY